MSHRAAVTIRRPPEELQRLWQHPDYRSTYLAEHDATVDFRRAPGDRGTEIHVEVRPRASGPAEKVVETVVGSAVLAHVKDELRHFKQQVETGEIPRSDGTPEGERAERKLKQRPARPLTEAELQEVGA